MLAAFVAIGAGAWVGGLVTVIIVAAGRHAIRADDRVVFFRAFGRRFAAFFGAAAVIVIVPAVVLATIEPGSLTASIALLALALLVATAFGILQARRMTALRAGLAKDAVSAMSVRHNAIIAAVIRTILVVGYVVLLILAVLLASIA